MSTHKVVTVDDLRQAILTLDDKKGHDRWTIQEVYDALPAPPLDADVGGVPHPAVIIAELETAYGYRIVPIDEYVRLRNVEALWDRAANSADKAYREEATDER